MHVKDERQHSLVDDNGRVGRGGERIVQALPKWALCWEPQCTVHSLQCRRNKIGRRRCFPAHPW